MITVRGFSLAKAFLEMYKKSFRKCIKKSKGTKKTLIGISNIE